MDVHDVATTVLLTVTVIVIGTTIPTLHEEEDFTFAWKKPFMAS
jgi:hypothetical protein